VEPAPLHPALAAAPQATQAGASPPEGGAVRGPDADAPPEAGADSPPEAAPSGPGSGELGEGLGAGGDGSGSGAGAGSGPGRGRPGEELRARVVGGRPGRAGEAGIAYIPLDEATELRAYDHFPRLPSAWLGGDRAYLAVVEICVSAEGRVSRASTRESSAPRLDGLLLAGVRTWRYRARLVDGRPQPFCHVLAIKYERW
jgi:hypothetical protein